MEADSAVSDWIKVEDEAEALKARARMIRRVSAVMDPPLINLIEASAYHKALCLSLPPTSPVSHAGHTSLVFARARAPTHLAPMGPQWIAVRMLNVAWTAGSTHPLHPSACYSPNTARRQCRNHTMNVWQLLTYPPPKCCLVTM